METNPQLELAFNFLEYTGTSIFLTGKAGTGKTTFLRELKRRSPKRMIVVAPTGVAAINAGGVTIHSFFQLPFGPYVPGRTEENRSGEKRFNHKFGREKINIIRSMDLLVIDEIGVQTESRYEKVIINQIVDRRSSSKRPTGMLTNHNIDEMTRLLGERVMDRMKLGNSLYVIFDWESYRSRVTGKEY